MPAQKRLQIASFLFLLLVMAGLAFSLVRPFTNILVFGFILSVLFQPVFHWFLKHLKSESWAALATVGVMLLIVAIPVVVLGKVLFSQTLNLYNNFKSGDLVISRGQIISGLPVQLQDFVQNATSDLNALASKLTANAFQTFSSLVSNLATFLLSLFLTLFTLYYLLKDGHKFKTILLDISPIDNEQEQLLFVKVSSAVNGVVKGQFLTALVQGVVATIGFVIFGMPNFLIWGMFTTLAALVPTVGTSLALVPAVLFLLITGHVGQAVGLAIWGALAVGLVDNVVGPRLIGKSTKVHPLLMLVAVLGGLSVFGFLGFLLGPILMAVFVAVVDMYRTDFQKYLEQ